MRVLLYVAAVLCVGVTRGCLSDKAAKNAPGSDASAVPSSVQKPVASAQKVTENAPGSDAGVSPSTVQEPVALAPEGQRPLLEIEHFGVDHENLRLDYRVNNVFAHEIWICTDLSSHNRNGGPREATRIKGETFTISRRGNLERNLFIQGDDNIVYHRLPARQSYRDTILLPLPLRTASPVFMAGNPYAADKPVSLNCIVFELGYYDEDLRAMLDNSEERGWGPLPAYAPIPPELRAKFKARAESGDRLLSFLLGSPDPNIAWVPYIGMPWRGLEAEQSVQVTISDTVVPGTLKGMLRDQAVTQTDPNAYLGPRWWERER